MTDSMLRAAHIDYSTIQVLLHESDRVGDKRQSPGRPAFFSHSSTVLLAKLLFPRPTCNIWLCPDPARSSCAVFLIRNTITRVVSPP